MSVGGLSSSTFLKNCFFRFILHLNVLSAVRYSLSTCWGIDRHISAFGMPLSLASSCCAMCCTLHPSMGSSVGIVWLLVLSSAWPRGVLPLLHLQPALMPPLWAAPDSSHRTSGPFSCPVLPKGFVVALLLCHLPVQAIPNPLVCCDSSIRDCVLPCGQNQYALPHQLSSARLTFGS